MWALTCGYTAIGCTGGDRWSDPAQCPTLWNMTATSTEHRLDVLKRNGAARALRVLRDEGDDEVTINALYKLNQQKGMPRTNVDASQLIPWTLRQQDKNKYDAMRLRDLARRMAGQEVADLRKLTRWLQTLQEEDLVIDYTPLGFVRVKRRWYEIVPGVEIPIDTWIKDPNRNDDGTLKQ